MNSSHDGRLLIVRRMMRSVDDIQTIGVVGCGLIGTGWIIQFLASGFNVVAFDEQSDVERKVRSRVLDAWPEMEELGLAQTASPDNLTFANSLDGACGRADFIQENLPEHKELKQRVLHAIDMAASPDILIASSTSGITKAVLEERCERKDRVIVGHPFLPVHLLPLVEIVADSVAAPIAEAFYKKLGKVPIVLKKDVPGFIGNRFQETILREAFHMVAAGEATPDQIDLALMNGPALRWPFMGPFLSAVTSYGSDGFDRFVHDMGGDEFFEEGWSRMPTLDVGDHTKKAVKLGLDKLIDGQSYEQRAKARNRRIIAIRKASKL